MFPRAVAADLRERLGFFPGVVLLGPRQVGKTTLARAIAGETPGATVLDLEKPGDRARLEQPELFLAANRERLVVLDEVQRLPGIFEALRPEIDADRRPGRFLLLASASGRLLQQGSESLTGRVSHLELSPLLVSEACENAAATMTLWQRGGFPPSLGAPSDSLSFVWRQDFVQALLQRDLPQLGVNLPAETLHRFCRMLAHLQGQAFNASRLGASLGGLSHSTVGRYLDTLVDAMVVRRLEPWLTNSGKRLVKSPKVYIRDSGLLHALLGIPSMHDLLGHPATGASWEGFVLEQVLAHAPVGAATGFYRTAVGAEVDIVVGTSVAPLAFEVKFSYAPKPTRGFWQAIEDVGAKRAFVVAPVETAYPIATNVEVIPVRDIPRAFAEAA